MVKYKRFDIKYINLYAANIKAQTVLNSMR